MQKLAAVTKGTPTFKLNALYRCQTCMSGKLATRRKYKTQQKIKETVEEHCEDICDSTKTGLPGQHFHIDFGFVRGQDDNSKKIHNSIGGYNCYVLIID